MVPDAISSFRDMKLQEVTFENEYELIDTIGIVQEMTGFLYEKHDMKI